MRPGDLGQLVECPGIVPAPYMARNHWVALEEFSALRDREIEDFVAESHRLVVGRLPRKTQRELAGEPAASRPRASRGR